MKKLTGYMHGINLGGWLSQCDHTKERYDNFIKEEDIKRISEWGLDHVRLPIDYDLVEDKEGNYIESGFGYIDNAIEWAGKYGLNLVLDVHKTFGFSFDDGENEEGFFENERYQERFYRLWDQLSMRYGKFSDRVCFELLNEVTKKEYSETWNRIAHTCVDRIRKNAPDIKILIGSYYNNSIEGMPDLDMPYDENIVYNFHFYEPLIFTHQGAYWVEGLDPKFRMPYDSTYADYEKNTKEQLKQFSAGYLDMDQNATMGPDYFEARISEAVRVAEERDVALYCGEYGVIDQTEAPDRLKWYKDACGVFEKHGIARAAWTYKEMDFGLIDKAMEPLIDELVKIL